MTYSDRFGDRYTSLGAQTPAPKKHFNFSFFTYISTKKCVVVPVSDFTMHLIIFEMALKTKMQIEEKNNETVRGRSERRTCLRNCFHSFKYVIEHANVCFFLSKLYTLHRVITYILLAASSHIALRLSQGHSHTIFFYFNNI